MTGDCVLFPVAQRQELVEELARRVPPARLGWRAEHEIGILAEWQRRAFAIHLRRRGDEHQFSLPARVPQHGFGPVHVGFESCAPDARHQPDANGCGKVEDDVGGIDQHAHEPRRSSLNRSCTRTGRARAGARCSRGCRSTDRPESTRHDPGASRVSARCDPMKPAPPVMSARMISPGDGSETSNEDDAAAQATEGAALESSVHRRARVDLQHPRFVDAERRFTAHGSAESERR